VVKSEMSYNGVLATPRILSKTEACSNRRGGKRPRGYDLVKQLSIYGNAD
jgi:hypothetical protein